MTSAEPKIVEEKLKYFLAKSPTFSSHNNLLESSNEKKTGLRIGYLVMVSEVNLMPWYDSELKEQICYLFNCPLATFYAYIQYNYFLL